MKTITIVDAFINDNNQLVLEQQIKQIENFVETL